jgi:hypothetical protein
MLPIRPALYYCRTTYRYIIVAQPIAQNQPYHDAIRGEKLRQLEQSPYMAYRALFTAPPNSGSARGGTRHPRVMILAPGIKQMASAE